MTAEWLNQARRDRDKLVALIRSFHPHAVRLADEEYQQTFVGQSVRNLPITAPNAERARRNVVASIRREDKTDPVALFELALETNDAGKVMSILNSTWFGVPESTSCWKLEGFKEAVELLEDPPEDDEEVNAPSDFHGGEQ